MKARWLAVPTERVSCIHDRTLVDSEDRSRRRNSVGLEESISAEIPSSGYGSQRRDLLREQDS